MQQFMVVGRVGSEVKFFDKGSVPFASVSLAENQYYKDKDTGEKKQYTTWFPVVGYKSKAEFMRNYLKVGSKVAITGVWKNMSYEKDGKKYNQMALRLSQVEFCDTKAKVVTKNDVVEQNSNDGFVRIEQDNPFGADFNMPSYVPGVDDEDGE